MKTYYVDIDGTICNNTNGRYSMAEPREKYIAFVNELYDQGNHITYWTARGATTGIDWSELTKNQLDSWGCKYHKLKMNKPFYDVFLDDKAMSVEEYSKGDN